jgi:hypothetical protein
MEGVVNAIISSKNVQLMTILLCNVARKQMRAASMVSIDTGFMDLMEHQNSVPVLNYYMYVLNLHQELASRNKNTRPFRKK